MTGGMQAAQDALPYTNEKVRKGSIEGYKNLFELIALLKPAQEELNKL